MKGEKSHKGLARNERREESKKKKRNITINNKIKILNVRNL